MVQQMSIYSRRLKEMDPAEAAILNNFHSAQGAEFRHGDRKGCLKGTRVAVLDEIALWARDFDRSPIYWLNGLAGTGKTTIAQTVAERLFADGNLGASFFCSRDFEDRSDLRSIFPTLAVQLARNYAQFRSVFLPLARSDPGIAHESLYNQMERLITVPLRESATSTVIVIDALDECKDEETASAILSVLGRLVFEAPQVKIFLTGRPEPRIQTGFRLPLLKQATNVFVLHEVKPNLINNDVRLFFKHSFLEMANYRGGLDGWPADEEVERLCERTAGLFVYAVATVKFIDKRATNPRKQLSLLLQSPESSVREAKTKFKTNTSLDSLYMSILQEAFGDDIDPDNDPKVRAVVGAMLLAVNPLSPSTIAALLDFDVDDVFPLLSSSQSLLILQEDINCPVRPFHKSFPDFIIDPDRCTDRRFQVSPPHHHSQLLISCLNLISRNLEKNICKLPDGVANLDIDDLKERTERYINPAMQYACRSWHTHLVSRHTVSDRTLDIISAVHHFLENKFIFWLEVLSVLGAVRNAVEALQAAAGWLEESPTLDLANDCSRFITQHFDIIRASSPHIYHSALLLTPRESMVQKLYKAHVRPFVRVVQGIPASWDSNTPTSVVSSKFGLAVWSPCNRFIAISPGHTMTADILDSATLQRLQSLPFSRRIALPPEALAFSPDSRMLTFFIRGQNILSPERFVVSWDLHTGGVVSAIEWKGFRDTKSRKAHIIYLMDGKTVAVISRYDDSTIISIYDVVSGVHMHNVDQGARTNLDLALGVPYVYTIWAHEASLRFATHGPMKITTWEVGFAPGATPTEIESVSIPDIPAFKPGKELDLAWTEFHPASCRLAVIRIEAEGTLLIWDARASKLLLHHTNINFRGPMTFSSDARFFSCSAIGSEVHLWKESPTGYALFAKLAHGTSYSQPYLSPDGGSIITFSYSAIQLWHTKSFTTTTSTNLAQALQHTGEDFVLEFLPERLLAVAARKEDRTVTVLDLKSGVPQLVIETPIKVYGLGPIENTIIVVGDKEVITWNLPTGGLPPDARMSVEDSTQTIDFHDDDSNAVVVASTSPDLGYIAWYGEDGFLEVYCTSDGQNLRVKLEWASVLWFSPGGHNIWCVDDNQAKVFTITQDTLDHTMTVLDVQDGSWGCPWGSSRCYKNGWILGEGGNRLLMLPPLWQSLDSADRIWSGKFIALLHGGLPEPVILELEP